MLGKVKLIALLWVMLTSVAVAQNIVQLINNDEAVRLSTYFKVLPETDQQYSIDQVLLLHEEFVWQPILNPNYGFRDSGLWLSATFSNVTDTKNWVVDLGFTQLDIVDFYLVIDGKVVQRSQQGKARLNQSYRYPTMALDLPYAIPVSLFVRIESASNSLIAPIDIQPATTHIKLNFYDNILWGLFYGGLLILAIYNFVLYFGNREKSLLAYVGYISTAILWQFVWGGHLQVLFPLGFTSWLSQHIDLIFVALGIGSGVFTYTFLDAPDNAPKSTPMIRANIIVLAVLGLCSMLNLLPPLWQNGLVYLVSILAISSYLFAGFESFFNHFQPAKYFIFAWSILACCALIGMLSLVGFFPSNSFTTYCFQIGVFLEAGLFSLALMDKSRGQLEREIQQATNDLRNNMEFIEEQNVRLDIARKDAIKASHIKSQFLANMSHEIRTPLNAILGFSRELTQLDLPAQKQEQVMIINNAADNLLAIVNDVLDVSKIEAGKLQINNQPFSPNQLLEEMVNLMAKTAHQKKLEFVFELGALPDKLIGDVTRIKQILNNLLSNALKFTSSGYIRLSAAGKTLDHGMFQLTLKIEDTGIGISPQDRKKLFNAFTQVDDALSRSYQGTGLGLVICQQLVKLMHGKITLTTTPGEGSCFTVTLNTNLLSTKCSYLNAPDWTGKQVLLLDLNSVTRSSSKTILEMVGCKVSEIGTLDELFSASGSFDMLFATLPVADLANRESIYAILDNINASRKMLLYSGPEPLTERPDLVSKVESQIRLPLTPIKLDNLLHKPKQTEKTQLQQRLMELPRAKVLAVDDMEMNLKLLKTWFKPSSLELTLAFSGSESVSLCEQQEFDLILMDVQMPNMDGLQATQLIRQTELNIGTPIIAVTAHAFKEEQERLLASGMDDYLPKPIDLNDLVNLIKRWCLQQEHKPLSLPSLDWELAMKRANHNFDAAKEVLSEFSMQLPKLIDDIEVNWKKHDLAEVQAIVHKLHGACCYTGVPKLLALCDEIEGALKCDQVHHVAERIPSLVIEAELVISETEKHLNELVEL